ncbi:hypothetical protein FA95DRAFT_1594857 [Auriscalpium vulgare]|uniref:Uncharacterized protein n=1 Tax=Auriscalpium vulgare TaxID=40419 RepID=A0ACB8RYJ2_9AGAM|nr:hypothetical protein FA95DRAFT_1594857 [Auriscalpium vulgare]
MSVPAFDTASEFKYTESPNPAWKFGEKVGETEAGRTWLEGESKGWTAIRCETEDPGLLVSGIVPRPIAFVSSVSETGVENLAPFSWFNQVSSNPPVISISCNNAGPGRYKDTLNNIKATKSFTVNIISEPFIEQANSTSIDAPSDVSEWIVSGLTKEPSTHVKAPRVRESAFSMEAELLQEVPITHPATGATTTTLILGLVKYIHVRNDVLTEKGTVDPALLKAVGRLGDITYGRIGDRFRLKRPNWEEVKDDVEEIAGKEA